jgi:hypothetical protein
MLLSKYSVGCHGKLSRYPVQLRWDDHDVQCLWVAVDNDLDLVAHPHGRIPKDGGMKSVSVSYSNRLDHSLRP